MIIVNLQSIGPVPHKFCSKADLMAIFKTACEILDETEDDILDKLLDDWEAALTWRSLDELPVDEAWYTRALLVICLRGMRGEIAPQFYCINKDD